MSWYSKLVDENANAMIKIAMQKYASSLNQLWDALNKAGVTDKMGIQDKITFQNNLLQNNPEFIENIGRHTSGVNNQAQQQNIESAYANYISGRTLAEEINNARTNARTENRDPTVAELRAARRKANERLSNEWAMQYGVGMPSQIHVGRRGPLGRIRLKQLEIPPERINDPQVLNMANQILSEEQERSKAIAFERYKKGESASPEPTAADMRAAIFNTNKRLEEGLKFRIGKRGPLPAKFELNRNIQNSKEYYEWKKKQKKKENLGLSDVLDVEPGNIAVPHPDNNPADNFIPEETMVEQQDNATFNKELEIIQKQANYPVMPPLHPPTCRCRIVQEGKTFKWQTAGDDFVCDECNKYADEFNSIRNT